MALSRKLTKPEKKHVSVEALILKGGSSGGEETHEAGEEEDVKRVQLRIPVSKLEEIDKLKKRRPGKLSRHTWIMEAIEEKLLRDAE